MPAPAGAAALEARAHVGRSAAKMNEMIRFTTKCNRLKSIAAAYRLHHVAQLQLYGMRHRFMMPDEAAHDPHRRKSA
jgi:hypothetical protein